MFNMKYFITFSVLLFMALGYKTYEQYNHINNTHKLIILNESQALANFITSFRQTYQDTFIENHIDMKPEMINLLPVKTISEISKRFAVRTKEDMIIRMVSDRPRNPKNLANSFEMKMIEEFKKHPNKKDAFLKKDNTYFYTKPMRIVPSCLRCHGKRENAIPSIRDRYTTAYNYKLGEIRGLLNIQIKDNSFFEILYDNFINTLSMTIMLYVFFLAIIYLLVKKMRMEESRYTENLESQIVEKTSMIQKQKETFETLFEKSTDGILIIYKQKFIQCNEKAVKVLNAKSKEDILSRDISDFSSEFQPDGLLSTEKAQNIMQKAVNEGGIQVEWLSKKLTGEIFWIEISLTPIILDNKHVIYAIARDISDKKVAQEKLLEQKDMLYHRAHHDVLTGLPNRALFNDCLECGIEKAKYNNTKIALFFIDLDEFKQINDSLGHEVGDRVLNIVAERLKAKVRKEDTLARLGGDEFTIIIEDYKNIENVSLIAESILKVLIQPMHIDGHTLYLSCSIGISLYPKDDDTADNLLKYADAAMYKAKESGRNNYQFYHSDMTELAFERIHMKAGLRQALINNEFVLYYQPQIDAQNKKLIGMEALIRWNHPKMGIVLPSKFIPLAEECGLIVEIDQWVMKTAMLQMYHWYNKGFQPGTLALNLTLTHLRRDNYIFELQEIFKERYFRAEWLELEITENAVMNKFDEVISKLQLIHSMGISIAIDDFGTGHSSLSYLKKLPANKLKIDKSFIDEIPHNKEDVAIIKAIIALGKNLNLTLLAEGVEREEQKDFLLDNGCQLIQGYFFDPALTSDEIEEKYFTKN